MYEYLDHITTESIRRSHTRILMCRTLQGLTWS